MSRDYFVGKRVQVPVWTDTWMMGDRFGVVIKVVKRPGQSPSSPAAFVAHVLLDKSKRTKKFRVSDLEAID